MLEKQSNTNMQVGSLIMGEGTKALVAIAGAIESIAVRGDKIPPELITSFQECAMVVKAAVDHVLPIHQVGNNG